jgi:probable phosphoglycerate mutase
MKRTSKSSPPGSARLFSEAHPAPPAGVHIANIDGASRGNPGPASYAVILRDPAGKVILELAKNLGRETNNVAEYYALLAALDYATSYGIRALRIRSDSELLVRQMQGRYKVKSADLKPLYERALKLTRQLEYFAIEHVPREMNREADLLANVALDTAGVPKFESRAHAGTPETPRKSPKSGPPVRQPEIPTGPDIPKNLKPYFVVLLFAGPNRDQPPEKAKQIFRAHVAYIHQQIEAGKFALAGPFVDDSRTEGIIIAAVDSAQEAQEILSRDPAIVAGRMTFEVHPALLPSLDGVVVKY